MIVPATAGVVITCSLKKLKIILAISFPIPQLRESPINQPPIITIMKYYEIRKAGLESVDVNLDIGLKEYGIAWRKVPTKNEIRFYFGVDDKENECGEMDYIEFGLTSFALDLDIRKEFNWIDLDAVCSFVGLDQDEWLALPIERQICDLNSYYGHENIF